MKKQRILLQALLLFSSNKLFCPGNSELARTFEQGDASPVQTRGQELAERNALALEMAQTSAEVSRREILGQEKDFRRELRIEKALNREYLAMRPEYRVIYDQMGHQEKLAYRQMSSSSRKQYLQRKWEEALRQIIGRRKEYSPAAEDAMSPEERRQYVRERRMGRRERQRFYDELGPVVDSEGDDSD